MNWIILELEKDILVLSYVSKFRKVPFEISYAQILQKWAHFTNKGQLFQNGHCDINHFGIGKVFCTKHCFKVLKNSDQNYFI